MDLKMLFILILSLMPLLFFVSCRHGYDDDGFPIIVQHRFWNYYERGLAKALQRQWQGAADDFQIALGEKKGALFPGPEEKSRTKMYGVRYFDDYFPNRELGICYYFLGDLDAAEQKLKSSLNMLPSSRAKFYFNKVTKAQLARLDHPPTSQLAITMEWPEKPVFTNKPHLTLRGKVTGNVPVEKIWINNVRQFFELAVTEYTLDEKISMQPGKNTIHIEAKNLIDDHQTWAKDVFIDLTGPEIAISSITRQPGERVRVDITDAGGISNLTINGKPIKIQEGTDSYSTEMDIKPKGTIKIKARDRAGNSSSIEHSAKELRRASLDLFKNRVGRKLVYHDYRQPQNISIAPTRPDIFLAQGLKVTRDEVAPVITLYPEISDVRRITTDYYILDVKVQDSGGIASVSIDTNGEQPGGRITRNTLTNDAILTRFSEVIYFEEQEESVYSIAVTARDHFGNTSKKVINLVRKRPHNRVQEYRLTLVAQAVAGQENSFTPIPRLDRHFARLTNKILLRPKIRRFLMIDRSKKTLHKLALEHILIHSDLVDLEKAVRSGKLRVADWYLRAVAVPRSGYATDENWEIYGNVMDVRTGELIMTEVVYAEGTDDLEFPLQLLIEKLYQSVPLHSDRVIKKRKNSITVSLGKEDSIHRNFRFMFIPQKEGNDPFAEPLVTGDGRWIQGIVTAVNETSCKVEIEPKGAIQYIHEKDLTFMR